MAKEWTADELNALTRSYQPAAVLMAAAELELFDRVGEKDFSAAEATRAVGGNLRAVTVLLDALAAMQIIEKSADRYRLPTSVRSAMTAKGQGSVLAMIQHQANCLRSWMQLAKVAKTGSPATREPSIRGTDADYASFVEAMDNISRPIAPAVIADLPLPPFAHVLDVGGASGTWTIALLHADPKARATIFDLPHVIPQAKQRIAEAGLLDRVSFAPGDFYHDPLPKGADLAWISAIVHQNSRQQNRDLFTSVFTALTAGGHVLIRDIVMDESRAAPLAGAMFAINMLVNTQQGGTFTLGELRADLEHAGFADVRQVRSDPGMHAIVQARKPA